MSVNSQELLRDTVHQLLSHGQCPKQVWEEVSSLNRTGSKDLHCITELCCVPVLKQVAVTSGQAEDVYSIKECVEKVMSLTRLCSGQELSDRERVELESTLSMVKQVLLSRMVRGHQFCQQLGQRGPVPVELIWRLTRHGVVSFENILQGQSTAMNFISSFVDRLIDYARRDTSVNSLADILSELVFLASQEKKPSTGGTDTRKMAGSVLDQLLLGTVDGILNDTRRDSCMNVIQAYSNIDVDLDILKKTSTHLLSLILCHRPVLKVSVAVKEQSQWTYAKVNPSLVLLYKQLLLPLEACEVLDILNRTVQEQEVNWRLVLSLVSVTVVCMQEASRLFLEFTDRLLQESLESCEMESAITGLLVARQACHQGPHIFMTYSDWFQRTFGDTSKSLASSRKSFVFLIKFLSDLVPYESAQHIKVHICRPPSVPAKCRQILTDYICLAKTRLEDLKESLEPQGQERTPGSSDKVTNELETEVNQAVSLFETTGKVPTSVLEASIFRKPHYIGQFLPALLKPRHLPDKPDAKMKLIASLFKTDKISQSMHSNYIKACRKESMQLLEGVFVDSDSDVEMELSPLEQFENSVRHCGDVIKVLCNEERKPKQTVEEMVSNICEAMEALVGCRPSQQSNLSQESVNLSVSYIPSNLLQVVDRLLNFITQTLQLVYRSESPAFKWLQKLLLAVTQYSTVTEALLRRVWALLMKQASSLANHHVDGLAAVLVELYSQRNRIPVVHTAQSCTKCDPLRDSFSTIVMKNLQGGNKEQMYLVLSLANHHVDGLAAVLVELYSQRNRIPVVHTAQSCTKCDPLRDSFSTIVMKNLQGGNKEQMYLVLRLTSSYLKYALCAFDTEAKDLMGIPDLLKHFAYLATRLIPELRHSPSSDQCGSNNLAAALYLSGEVQSLLEIYQFSLEDWVSHEVMICPDQDALTEFERYEYHNWMVYEWFLARSPQAGGYGGNCMAVATNILRTLMDRTDRNQEDIGLCPDCQTKRDRQIIGYSRCYMVNLLQGLTRLFPAGKSKNKLPWLPDQLIEMLRTSSSTIHKQKAVQDFFNVCVSLPSYLLFINTPNGLCAGDICISAVADFINTVMVEYLHEGIYLSSSIAVYMAQGVLQAADRDDPAAVLDHICEICPVLTLSFIVNHPVVFQILQSVIESPTSVVGSLFQFYRTRNSAEHLDAWDIATVIFSHILLGTYSEDTTSLGEVYNIKNKHSQVYKKLTELLILQLTFLQNFSVYKKELQISRIQKSLVSVLTDGDTVSHLLTASMDTSTKHCCSEGLLKARYLTILRFLRDFGARINLQDKLQLPGLSGLLQGFMNTGNMLEQIDPDNDNSQCTAMSEWGSLAQFMIQLVHRVPITLLQQLNQDLVLGCGPGVADTVIRRLT